LSADHGSMPLVEVLRRRGIDARRVKTEELEAPVRQALETRFPGAGTLIAAADPPNFWLDASRLTRQGLKRTQVERVIREALLATGYIQRVYTRAELLDDAPADDPDFTLVRNSYFESRSPDVTATVKPYVYVSRYPGGTGHGTLHPYDRHVPVAFLGTAIAPGRYETPCGPEDIAPTLAALLGIDYVREEGQRVLTEALRDNIDPSSAPAAPRSR